MELPSLVESWKSLKNSKNRRKYCYLARTLAKEKTLSIGREDERLINQTGSLDLMLKT